MRIYIHIFILFISIGITAQSALYNAGGVPITIHQGDSIGFHTNFINDGVFNDTKGFVGFYGDTDITISGNPPTFNNVEIATEDDVYLETIVNVLGEVAFMNGDFVTQKNLQEIYLNFIQNSYAIGETDESKVNGYVTIENKQNFRFPVGNEDNYKPLILNSEDINIQAKCAYYLEDPNDPPETFNQKYNTSRRPRTIAYISKEEFWHLEGSIPSNVTLSYNQGSKITSLTDNPEEIIVVGWSKTTNRWEPLGNITGAVGFSVSETFTPNDYEIITLGTLAIPKEILKLDNYLVTPNGDRINDELVIEELTFSPNNSIQIFDRYGLKVFEKTNYTDEFNGFSNVGNVVLEHKDGLPSGVYFYLITLKDLDLHYQGFLYLTR